MGGFIIFNTFRTIVAERRHDIGMLRAVGASRRTIITLILTEGVILGIAGTMIGIILGYLLGSSLVRAMGPMLNQFLHVEIGNPVIQPGLFVTTIALGVGVTLLAGLLPAWNAGRVTPLEALRPPVAEASQRVARWGLIVGIVLILLAVMGLLSGNIGLTSLGGLLFMLGLVMVAPGLVRPIARVFSALIALIYARDGTGDLAQGNLTRQPTRAAVTASATMVGLAVVVAMGGMVYSLTDGFWWSWSAAWGDYLVMPPSVGVWGSNVEAESADRLRAVPGGGGQHAAMQPLHKRKQVSLLGTDPVNYPRDPALTRRRWATPHYSRLGMNADDYQRRAGGASWVESRRCGVIFTPTEKNYQDRCR
jgi:putative ABC transport system permease protein